MPQRGVPKRALFEQSAEDESDELTTLTNVSVASTIILPDSDDGKGELSPERPTWK